jgi:hypothetical protein
MANRDETSAVMAGLEKHDVLLTAFLEATGKIDLRALRKRAATGEMPEPVNVEAQPVEVHSVEAHLASAIADTPQVDPPKPPALAFALRRANLVRVP